MWINFFGLKCQQQFNNWTPSCTTLYIIPISHRSSKWFTRNCQQVAKQNRCRQFCWIEWALINYNLTLDHHQWVALGTGIAWEFGCTWDNVPFLENQHTTSVQKQLESSNFVSSTQDEFCYPLISHYSCVKHSILLYWQKLSAGWIIPLIITNCLWMIQSYSSSVLKPERQVNLNTMHKWGKTWIKLTLSGYSTHLNLWTLCSQVFSALKKSGDYKYDCVDWIKHYYNHQRVPQSGPCIHSNKSFSFGILEGAK